MNESFSTFSGSNPFSTRFTAPGKAPFFFESSLIQRIQKFYPTKFEEFLYDSMGQNEDLQQSVCIRYLVDRFETHSCRGQIVGKHGTGKSTLVSVLKGAMIKQGYEIFSWSLHDQTRFLPDVFWLELQKFLQSIPILLPTKFLLPPPVMSPEEYLSQQQDFLKEVFPEKNFDVSRQPVAETPPAEEVFQVSDSALASAVKSDAAPSDSGKNERTDVASSSDAEKRETTEGFFGFNEAGNFGLKSGRLSSSDSKVFRRLDAPVKFDPFPGVSPVPEAIASPAKDEYDDVELANPEDDNLPAPPVVHAPSEQKKLELPLNFDYDSGKKGSFFDKKVLIFDGFEQLSFANRVILRTFCRMNRLGLLLTTHVPVIGVPVLYKTEPTVAAIHQLLDYLLEDYDDFQIDDSEVEILLKNFRGDVREMLFSLYDAFENYRLAPRDLREKIVRRYPR